MLTDKDLDNIYLDRWRSGDQSGFSEIYDRYKGRVFGFLYKLTKDRYLAEDIMQETFFAALRNLDQFDKRRSFLSWLFGIAHKKAIDFFRHKKVESNYSEEGKKAVGSKLERPDQTSENNDIMKLVNEAVEQLEPEQRDVFLMRELGGIPFKEISEIMDCPLNTALGRMRLALLNIRKYLEKRGVYGM